MKNWTLNYILAISLITFLSAKANYIDDYPQIGKPLESYVFNDIHYYHKKQAALSDFRGKWLILQFWGEYCSGSLNSLPQMNELQKKFANSLQIMLIGDVRENPETIQRLYSIYREKYGLVMPIVFDNELKERFDVGGFPFIMVIDPNGTLRAVTNRLNESELQQFLNGESPEIPKGYFRSEVRPNHTYNRNMPVLVNNNGGDNGDFLYRSLISKWNENIPSGFRKFSEDEIEILGMDLKTLYKLAYIGRDYIPYFDSKYGEYWPEVIVETADSSIFVSDAYTGKNLFCYSYTVTNETKNPKSMHFPDKHLQDILKRDLHNFFSHRVEIEERKMPYCKMVIDNQYLEKLKSKGGDEISKWKYGHRQGFLIKNRPIGELIPFILSYIDYPINIPLIYDGDKDIRIDLNVESSFFSDLKDELKSQGILLEFSEKEMKVLVVK